jgi:hypothetical protein
VVDAISLFSLGRSAVRLIARLLGVEAAQAADDLAEIGAVVGKDIWERRRITRALEEAADAIAEGASEYITHEYKFLRANDIEAITLAVRDTLDGFAAPKGTALVQVVTDPSRFTRALMRNRGARLRRGLASVDCADAYDRLLHATVEAVSNVMITTHEFTPQALKALVQSDRRLHDKVDEALRALNAIATAHAVKTDTAEAFKRRYLESVARKYDELLISGLDLVTVRRRYSLTDAYVPLSLRPVDEHNRNLTKGATTELSLEHVLGRSKRILLVGEPGAGKSTVTQWLAVQAARSQLPAEAAPWNGCVPFLVRLRDHANAEMPRLADLGRDVPMAGDSSLPESWAEELLRRGKAFLVLDGLDELASSKRLDVYAYISDMRRAYVDMPIMVTTRPSALKDTPFAVDGFDPVYVSPMNLLQQQAFIEDWHRATMPDDLEEDREARITNLVMALRAKLYANRELRQLARNPLLCSVVCALHASRRGHLPRSRSEIYETSLDLLLARREEDDKGLPASPLAKDEKAAVLEELAHWLTVNGLSTIDIEELHRHVRSALSTMRSQARKLSSQGVIYDLIERTGLLRYATTAKVEFSHRTFQEYMAAKRHVAKRNMPLLLSRVDSADWYEVIAWAPAFMTQVDADDFVSDVCDILEDAEAERRIMLTTLALACNENALQLDYSVRERVERLGAELVPPRDPTAVSALVSLGTPAVSFVAGGLRSSRTTTNELRMSIETLARLGGDDALAVLAALPPHLKAAVAPQLGEAWSQFEAEPYARMVLGDVPLDGGRTSLVLRDGQSIAAARWVSSAYELSADVSSHELRQGGGLEGLSLTLLRVRAHDGGWDLSGLDGTQIESLLFSFPDTDLSVDSVYRVRSPERDGTPSVHEVLIEGGNGKVMRTVDVSSLSVSDVALVSLSGSVCITGMAAFIDQQPLGALILKGSACLDWSGIRDSSFETLEVAAWPFDSLEPLRSFVWLERLTLSGSLALRGLHGIEALERLEYLDVSECEYLDEGLDLLRGLPNLSTVILNGCLSITDAEVVLDLASAIDVEYEDTGIDVSYRDREPEVSFLEDVELDTLLDVDLAALGWMGSHAWLAYAKSELDPFEVPGAPPTEDEVARTLGLVIVENLADYEDASSADEGDSSADV